MTSDPSKISHAAESIIRVDVESILDGDGSAQEVASDGVQYALWFAGGPRCLHRRVRTDLHNSK